MTALTVTRLLAAFVTTSLVMGVLAAGLVIPPLAGLGTVARSGTELYDALPSELTSVVPDQQSQLLAADGRTVIATLYNENRIVVPLTAVAPAMRHAQVAIEDHRFYEHGGVDLEGIGSAVAGAAMGGTARGASTLTQQYVKVTLETAARRRGDQAAAQAATEVSAARKVQELKYAVAVERRLSKDQILQNYLNLAYFGDGAYGVEAAARHYFGTTAARLTVPPAATLAGVVQQPGANDPVHNPRAALARRATVLGEMHRYGYLDAAGLRSARAAPLGVVRAAPPRNSCAASPYPFWCDYVLSWLREQPALGRTPQEREGRVRTGGLRIVTTLDPRLQSSATTAMAETITARDYPRYGAAAVTLETRTGKVRSMVQSARYGRSGRTEPGATQVNWATDFRHGGSGGFSVGSTMKLFAVVEAVRQGLSPDHVITGIRPEHSRWYPRDFQPGCSVGPAGWPVKNAEGESDAPQLSLREATAQSVNTAFVALASETGTCRIRDTALAMGMHTSTGADRTATDGRPLSSVAPIILLGADASPTTMAQMYAAVANRGISCPATPIESVTGSDGTPLDLRQAGCRRVLDERVADQAADVFTSVMTEGTGRAVQLGRPAIGKTGTDEDNETWFTGATPDYATSVWAGTPDENRRDWTYPTLHDATGRARTVRAQAFRIPGPIWQGIMRSAHEGRPVQALAVPPHAPPRVTPRATPAPPARRRAGSGPDRPPAAPTAPRRASARPTPP